MSGNNGNSKSAFYQSWLSPLTNVIWGGLGSVCLQQHTPEQDTALKAWYMMQVWFTADASICVAVINVTGSACPIMFRHFQNIIRNVKNEHFHESWFSRSWKERKGDFEKKCLRRGCRTVLPSKITYTIHSECCHQCK